MMRPVLGLTAGILVLSMAGSGRASAQNTNGAPGSFRGGPGRAGRGGPGFPGGFNGPMAFLEPLRMAAAQLGLTDSQTAQIRSIAQSHADEWKALADREIQARQNLQTAITAAQFDELTIRQRSADLAAVEADAAVARARVRAEVLPILSADQQAKLTELESGRGRGRGRGGAPPARPRAQ